MPEPGSTDQWVQEVLLYRGVAEEAKALCPELNLLGFLRKRGIPLYVRLDTSRYIAFKRYGSDEHPSIGFDARISFLRLSDRSIDDLQRAEFSTRCTEFFSGALAEDPGNDSIAPGYWQVAFLNGYAVELVEKRAWDANSRGASGLYRWDEYAVSYLIDLGNLYIEKRDLEEIRHEFIPGVRDFPVALDGVTPSVRSIYRAAYEFESLKLLKEDVLVRLSKANEKVFAVKRLDEASKLIAKDHYASGTISLGGLDHWKEGCEDFLSQGFIGQGLHALIVATIWWSNYAEAADNGLILALKARLAMMGFKKSAIPHLIKIIVGDTRWRGVPIDDALEGDVDEGVLEQYP
ncbi:hypothetical protein [Xanthomonas cannabis]|uniref:hypothetical protein n=1 Tax=Xanthomonas cannabis TaxID=1885674 RepID=UPI00339EA680